MKKVVLLLIVVLLLSIGVCVIVSCNDFSPSQSDQYKYTVTLNPMGGTVVNSTITVQYDENTEFPIPLRENYVFLGWSFEKDGELYTDETATNVWSIMQDATLYAQWELCDRRLQISISDINAGSIDGTESGVYKHGLVVRVNTVKNMGYDFIGWFDGDIKMSDELSYSFTLTKDVDLIAKYQVCAEYEMFTFSSTEDEIIITGVKSDATDLVIPDGVTSIGDSAFSGCSSLTSITIPDNVTSIGSNAFAGCGSLKKVYIEDIAAWYNIDFSSESSNPLSCGAELYLNGELVTYSVIPDGVTSIGDYAFADCSSLTSITIPDSVTSIGSNAFAGCSSLKRVYIDDIAAWCNIDFSSESSNPLSCGAKLYLNGELVINLVIPDGETSIGDYAFDGCSSLRSITIPDSVTSIGEDAFYRCSFLKKIYIEDIVAWCNIGFANDTANPLFYAAELYLNGELVTDLVIPDGVTSIGDYAFSGCSSLTSITIPSSIKSIGRDAFYGCSSLKKVYIDDIAAWCNIDFSSQRSNPLDNYAYLYLNGECVRNLVIPDGVTSIGDYAFVRCQYLGSITIPDSVTSIGRSPTWDCSSLERVYIDDIAAWCNIDFANSGSSMFSKDVELYFRHVRVTNLEIPDGVTSIADYAFAECDSFTSITIPDSVTSIGEGAFAGCSSLRSITIPDSVTSIGEGAFSRCSSLTSVTIPDGVTSIGDYAFYECLYLTNITIPDSVTSIGDYAFFATYEIYGISTYLKIIFRGTRAEWQALTEGKIVANDYYYTVETQDS